MAAPREGRLLSLGSLRWILRHRAWSRWHLLCYWRFLLLKLRQPHIVTEGMVFLGRGVELYARRGYGRLVLGRWVHVGDGTRLRAHEGTLRVGDKCVFGRGDTVNCYLDIEFGPATLIADGVYIGDFDHVFSDVTRPIKDQGIVKTPVRIGPDVWIGTKASVLRGVTVGRGSVLGAHTVVTADVPDYSVVAGVPGRVIASRLPAAEPTCDPPRQAAGSRRKPPRRS